MLVLKSGVLYVREHPFDKIAKIVANNVEWVRPMDGLRCKNITNITRGCCLLNDNRLVTSSGTYITSPSVPTNRTIITLIGNIDINDVGITYLLDNGDVIKLKGSTRILVESNVVQTSCTPGGRVVHLLKKDGTVIWNLYEMGTAGSRSPTFGCKAPIGSPATFGC